MKMHEVESITWKKMAEIKETDLSVEGIEKAIIREFGEPLFDDVEKTINDGYIEICEDGFIIWAS